MSPGLGIRGAKSLDPLFGMLVHECRNSSCLVSGLLFWRRNGRLCGVSCVVL